MSDLKSVISNIITADVSENFQFFMYTVNIVDSEGQPIESLFRRRILLGLCLWDGLFEDMPIKEKEDLQRVVFAQGSFFFSARKIPGLEPEKLPLALPISAEKSEGDSVKVMQFIHYVRPLELGSRSATKQGEVSFDKRCADCTLAFKDVGGLLYHW